MRDAVVAGGYHIDLIGYSDTGKMSPTAAFCRGWKFRRQGDAQRGDGAWRTVPTEVDLLPFAKFVETYQPSGTKTTPGSWLSVVQLLVELYDHQTGEITFHQPSTFTPENLS